MSGLFEPGTLSRSAQTIALERARLAQQKKRLSRKRKCPQPATVTMTPWRRLSPGPPARDTSRAAKLSPTQLTGRRYENAAARYLEAAGLTLIGRNRQVRTGEIDLIAIDQSVLVFIEVRARANDGYGGAAASVTQAKQKRIARAAATLLPGLTKHLSRIGVWPSGQGTCRFDVIAFEAGRLYWLRDAFVLTC